MSRPSSSGQGWEEIERWLLEIIAQPDRRLGRTGPLCPFVQRSLRASALLHRVEPDTSSTAEDLIALVMTQLEGFEANPWPAAAPWLRSLVLSFPNITLGDAAVLDEVQRRCKTLAIRAGYMIAQFHPSCDVRSVRNYEVMTGVGPIPLIAIRPMTGHDVLFLEDNETWITIYRERFRDTAATMKTDPFLARVIDRALRHDTAPGGES